MSVRVIYSEQKRRRKTIQLGYDVTSDAVMVEIRQWETVTPISEITDYATDTIMRCVVITNGEKIEDRKECLETYDRNALIRLGIKEFDRRVSEHPIFSAAEPHP